jgi:hypothetical protein
VSETSDNSFGLSLSAIIVSESGSLVGMELMVVLTLNQVSGNCVL